MTPQERLAAEIREATEVQFLEVAEFFTRNNLEALQAIVTDKSAPIFKVWYAEIALKAIKNGDVGALETLLDRIVGKSSRTSTASPSVTTDVAPLSAEARDARIAELERLDKMLGDD